MTQTINAVAPWVGELEWIGTPAGGRMQNGNEWRSVDFTLKYEDQQMNERHITFQAFGADKVEKLLNLPLGTTLKVLWWPESSQGKSGDRWWGKNNAIAINVVRPEDKPAPAAPQKREKITAPSYPQPQPPMPAEDRSYTPAPDDLPF